MDTPWGCTLCSAMQARYRLCAERVLEAFNVPACTECLGPLILDDALPKFGTGPAVYIFRCSKCDRSSTFVFEGDTLRKW